MKIIIFDTETTGLPKSKKAPPSKTSLWPYVCQVSWLVFDDSDGTFYTKDYIVKLPDGVTIPEVCTKIHGITNKQMLEEGVDINDVLKEFTHDWQSCQMLVAHNLEFDNKILQAEYHRNSPINWLGRHRKIEYCTMLYGKEIANIQRPSKFHAGTYQKPPKLIELHEKLFKNIPQNLHNSLIDVLVCFRCFYNMVYDKDILDINPQFKQQFKLLCGI